MGWGGGSVHKLSPCLLCKHVDLSPMSITHVRDMTVLRYSPRPGKVESGGLSASKA